MSDRRREWLERFATVIERIDIEKLDEIAKELRGKHYWSDAANVQLASEALSVIRIGLNDLDVTPPGRGRTN